MGELPLIIAALGGAVVAFSLALVGGGGSILAVPILVYAVGIRDPHLAIGTSAIGVGVNALIGLAGKARAGAVRWRAGLPFALAGVVGAAAGSIAGKAFDGQALLGLFALLMLVVAGLMLHRGEPEGHLERHDGTLGKLTLYGTLTGVLSGFFGIGGGFLVVPGLIAATAMPIFNAMATSLVAVAAFGITTAGSYALSGLVDWAVAGAFIGGGLIGSLAGQRLAVRLSTVRGALTKLFAGVIALVAVYMLWEVLR